MDTDVCHMVSQGSLTYTCTINGSCLFWNSSIFAPFNEVAMDNPHETRVISGTHFTVTHNGNETCLESTLIINGSLIAINDTSIRCYSCDKASASTVTIIVPGTCNVTCMHGNEYIFYRLSLDPQS